jgi:type II secretory pathway pseudopilin PulG
MHDNPYASNVFLQKKRRGFTWLELLVVICIIVVTICLMLPSLVRSTGGAWRTDSKEDLEEIARALRKYESIHHALPPAYTVDMAGVHASS